MCSLTSWPQILQEGRTIFILYLTKIFKKSGIAQHLAFCSLLYLAFHPTFAIQKLLPLALEPRGCSSFCSHSCGPPGIHPGAPSVLPDEKRVGCPQVLFKVLLGLCRVSGNVREMESQDSSQKILVLHTHCS